MNLQQIMSKTRRAVDQFNMIEEGDKIAVGLSGGKDSLALLYSLAGLRRFYPKKFEVVAITVDMGLGLDQKEVEQMQSLCKELDVFYHIEKTQIGEVVFEVRKESNPCSLCANMRRGALNSAASNLGCNKVALGHHADDLIETLFLSLFYEARLSTFSPVTRLTRKKITVIRPMIYLREMEIIGFTKGKPIIHNPCPADKNTRREYVKEMLKNLEKDNRKLRENVLGAIVHPERNNLFDDQILPDFDEEE